MEYNMYAIINCKLFSWIDLIKFKKWVYGQILPTTFASLSILISFYGKISNIIWINILLIPVFFAYYIVYFSYIDKLENSMQCELNKKDTKYGKYRLKVRRDKKQSQFFDAVFQLVFFILGRVIFLMIIEGQVSIASILYSANIIYDIPIWFVIICIITGVFFKVEKVD